MKHWALTITYFEIQCKFYTFQYLFHVEICLNEKKQKNNRILKLMLRTRLDCNAPRICFFVKNHLKNYHPK